MPEKCERVQKWRLETPIDRINLMGKKCDSN